LLLAGSFLWIGCSKPPEASVPEQTAAERFVVAGSGSNLPITGKLAESYMQRGGIRIELPKSIGSSGAIKAVREGKIDLGLISRPLKDSEKAEGIKQLSYARIGIVLGVNRSVPDDNLTYQDLVEIFKGTKTSWQNGKMIVVLAREKGNSSNAVLAKEIPGFREALKESYVQNRWQIYYTDAEEAHAIHDTPYSVGLTDTGSLSSLNLNIKPLQINGVPPSLENVQNGKYKLAKDLYFIYKEPLAEWAKTFLEFVYSEEGQAIIAMNGGIPLKGK